MPQSFVQKTFCYTTKRVRGASLVAACIEFRFEWRRTREMIEFNANLALILSSRRRAAQTKICCCVRRQENAKNLSRARWQYYRLSLMQKSVLQRWARNILLNSISVTLSKHAFNEGGGGGRVAKICSRKYIYIYHLAPFCECLGALFQAFLGMRNSQQRFAMSLQQPKIKIARKAKRQLPCHLWRNRSSGQAFSSTKIALALARAAVHSFANTSCVVIVDWDLLLTGGVFLC